MKDWLCLVAGKGRVMAALVLAGVLGGCAADEVPVDVPADVLELKAAKAEVAARGDGFRAFDPMTVYSIYAVYAGSDDWKLPFWNPNPRVCVESDGFIDYYSMQQEEPLSLGMKSVDFYGLTYGTEKQIAAENYDPEDPRRFAVVADEATGRVEDLMFSNNLKRCNSSQGTLQMDFRHAMSRVKFEVYKQDESNFVEERRYFEHTSVKEVRVRANRQGWFNVLEGSWSEHGALDDVVFYSAADAGKRLSVSAEMLPGHLLMIPNAAGVAVEVTVVLEQVGDGNQHFTQRTITHEIKSSLEGDILQFLPNHEYTLSIGVLREKGEIVIAFDPTVEPWQDAEIDLGET